MDSGNFPPLDILNCPKENLFIRSDKTSL